MERPRASLLATVLWPIPRRRLLLSEVFRQLSDFAVPSFRGWKAGGGGREGGSGDGLKFAGKTDNAVILEQAAKFAECSGESRLNYVFPRR